MNYGYQLGTLKAQVGNGIHERVEPKLANSIEWLTAKHQAPGSDEDFALSKAAIDAGNKMRNHQLTPLEFVKELDTILRTRNYGKLTLTPLII